MKEKIKNILSSALSINIYIKTFVVAVAVIIFLYITNDVAPFGTQSMLCVDFYHQYGPMLAELYDRVHSLSGFTYSFSMGMGLPFFRNFLNYLSSPFNIIIFFFRRSDLIMSYGVVIGLKAVMAAVTMVFFLTKKFKSEELYYIPLGLIYAFSAYFIAYYWNIMWLDGIVFLPLITLGIEYIIDKGKWKFYTIFLAIMLFANYFIGYMICIYAVVYFLIYLLLQIHISLKKGERLKSIKETMNFIIRKGLKFATASILAGALCAFALIPMFKSMSSISATGGDMPTTQYYDFEIVDYLKGHLTGVKVTTFASDEITNPNVSCGILAVALLLAFIVNGKIPLKTKLCYGLLLGFFIFAFFNPQLDYILHAFHVPNDLPYRYSFIYVFILVTIAGYAITYIKYLKFPVVLVGYIYLLALLFAISEDNWADLTTNMIYINMILLTLYFMFYVANKYIENKWNLFYYGLILIACVDCIVSVNNNWDISQVMSVFYQDYDATEDSLNYVEENDDEKFYRIENTNMMTLNDGSWYNYNGMTTFSSMAYESMAKLQFRLGMPGNQINSYYYVQSTPIYDIMFDIKYFIGERNDYTRYDEYYVGEEEKVNKFSYNVGLGFAVNFDTLNWNADTDDPFENQNDFIYKATGYEKVLKQAELNSSRKLLEDDNTVVMEYRYKNNYDNSYLYFRDYTVDFIVVGNSLYYNNENYSTTISKLDPNDTIEYTYVEDYDEEKIINIYSEDEELVVYVGYNNFYTKGFLLYQIDHNVLNDVYVKLMAGKMNITEYKESTIKANINIEANQIVYTSIPYDEGWHVYVDGKETTTYSLANALLVFDCPEGQHDITFKYKIPYFVPSLFISIIALVIVIVDYKYGKVIRKKVITFIANLKPKKKEKKKQESITKEINLKTKETNKANNKKDYPKQESKSKKGTKNSKTKDDLKK